MQTNRWLGPIILVACVCLFFPSYFHYNYKQFIKMSKAQLIYEHNKNYNRKLSFTDNSVYKIFNNSVNGEIEQITFTDLTLTGTDNSLTISLLGDKPFFFQLEKNFLHQTATSYLYGNTEERSFLLSCLQTKKTKQINNEKLMYQTLFLPYIPSYLGHMHIQAKDKLYLIAFESQIITADISLNENGLISSISTEKFLATYFNYKNEKGVQIPKNMTINEQKYQLKKIKMNILNTRR